MHSSLLPLDRDIDADDTVRVSALTPEALASFDALHEADIVGTSQLSFALLTELRTLTPTVQRAASRDPLPSRRPLRACLAQARASWRYTRGWIVRARVAMRPRAVVALAWAAISLHLTLAFVAKTSANLRARAERGWVAARPRVIAWARVARGYATVARSRAVSFARIPGRVQELARVFDRTRV
ncbi:MAG TPA: hypothetical protein VGM06_04645 [Polyangiaceae bacterium]|jgi:hypothetical protein